MISARVVPIACPLKHLTLPLRLRVRRQKKHKSCVHPEEAPPTRKELVSTALDVNDDSPDRGESGREKNLSIFPLFGSKDTVNSMNKNNGNNDEREQGVHEAHSCDRQQQQ